MDIQEIKNEYLNLSKFEKLNFINFALERDGQEFYQFTEEDLIGFEKTREECLSGKQKMINYEEFQKKMKEKYNV